MKLDAQHLVLVLLVLVALVGHVVLDVVGRPVPGVLDVLVTTGAGALFGITLPRGAGTSS